MNPLVTEARALCEGATEGPWVWEHEMGEMWGENGRVDVAVDGDGHGIQMTKEDGDLCARSRTLLPEMSAEIERLTKELARLTLVQILGEDREAELDALKADIEAGRLVRLPFKPGDVLYAIIPKSYEGDCDTHVSPWKSIAAVIYEDGSIAAMDCYENFDKIGTFYAYLTEAEALAAMKEDAHG